MGDTLEIEKYFDQAAASYDQQTSKKEDWAAPFYLKEELLKRPHSRYGRALVVGGGTGHDLDAIKDYCEEIHAIDISSNMLALMQLKYPGVKAIHGEFEAHDFGKVQYDLVVALGVLEFVQELDPFIRKCASLLSPDAYAVLTYEPVVKSYPAQQEKTDKIPCFDENGVPVASVQVYRRDIMEFVEASQDAGLEITSHFSFRAYTLENDVYYNLATLEKRS